MQKLPPWFKQKIPNQKEYFEFKNKLAHKDIITVCKEAKCPNTGECYSRGKMTFMILGDICTRSCGFCGVNKGVPNKIDETEINKICDIVLELNLKYVVITSVTRDDLKDGGASVFAELIKKIKNIENAVKIEVLTPDFKGSKNAVKIIADAKPDVFNHNLETVPSLYSKIRSGADFNRSLELLRQVKDYDCNIKTKSGIILGLGEQKQEVLFVFEKLRENNCDILTLGQYLRPSKDSVEVVRYLTPLEFDEYKKIALEYGFKAVFSGPLVRSSYSAEEVFSECMK